MYTAHMYKARMTIIATRKRNHTLHSTHCRGSKASQSAKRCALVLATYRAQVQDCRVVRARCRPPDLRNLHTPEGNPPCGGGGRGEGGDDRVDCLMDIGAQTQGLATLFLIPTTYASGPVNDSNWTVVGNTLAPNGTVTILDLGEVGCQG